MRRRSPSLIHTALAVGCLLLGTACDSTLPVPLPDFRDKAVLAVRARLDATSARLETRKVRDLYQVKLWMPDPATKEKVKAICWFDGRRQLVMVTYPE